MAIFTQRQLNELLDIINNQTSIFIASNLGADYLTDQEKETLRRNGVDVDNLYQLQNDPMFIAMQFGMLSEILSNKEAKEMKYDKLKGWIKNGKYVPLNSRERFSLDSVKNQAYGDIKSLNGKIFQDLNGIVNQTASESVARAQEKELRQHIGAGLRNRESVEKISREFANKTGDYSRNFDRIVEYVSHQAFDEGRANTFRRKARGKDPNVYKNLYSGACKHCIRLYLTAGMGSKPKVFKLSELEANGTNIGKKTEDWQPVVGSTHPHCRCTLEYIDDDMEWNEEKGKFERTEERQPRVKRDKVKIMVGDEEHYV